MHKLIEKSHAYGDKVALRSAAGDITHGALARRAWALAARLDIAPGDFVAALIEPGPDFVVAFWATVWRGGIFVPLALSHPDAEMAYVLDDAAPCILLTTPYYRGRADALAAPRDVVVCAVGEPETASAKSAPVTGGGLMLYTSGTTGRPKGAVLLADAVAHQITTLVNAWGWLPGDVIVSALPLHHVHGLINVLSCALAVGAQAVWHDRFDASRQWTDMVKHRATVLMAVPTMYHRLLAALVDMEPDERERVTAHARGMRLWVSGSAALPAPVFESIFAACGQRPLERYGMTEIGMALGNPYGGPRVPGEVGVPFAGVDARLVDDSGGVIVGDGIGEIRVKGPSLFSHYHRREVATAAAYDAAGYFKTGDRAERRADRYAILGRQSVDILKSGGYKISALQIEAALMTHSAADEVCVVGVPHDDLGDEIVAVVILAGREKAPDNASWRGFLKPLLAPYKIPRRFLTRDALIKNAMGKVQKPAMLEWVRQQPVSNSD